MILFHADEAPGGLSGWQKDGYFYYWGASSEHVNRPVITAWSTGRPIQIVARLPRRPGVYRFVDSFVLEDQLEQGSTRADGRVELFPLFRLRTVHDVTHQPGQIVVPGDATRVGIRRVERLDLLCREAMASPLDSELPETRLSKAFERHLVRQGHPVHRLGIRHTVGCKQLLTDTWVGSLNLLIEAKAGKTEARQNVRMALGQLADYTRFVQGVRKAVLLPTRPIGDLLDLVTSQGADVIWPEGDRWLSTGHWPRSADIAHWSTGDESSAKALAIDR
ncbi:hypothetical protein ACI2LF_32030 [Kribbella sp. NPDC020789]